MPAHQMPLGDVRGFVRHDAGEFIFVARREDQAAVDGDEAAGHREGIDDGIAHHEVIELVLAFLGMAREAVADLLNVIADLGIFEDDAGLAHLAEPHRARPDTPPRAKPRRSRGCPNRADPDRSRWSSYHARSPADAHAAHSPRQRRQTRSRISTGSSSLRKDPWSAIAVPKVRS